MSAMKRPAPLLFAAALLLLGASGCLEVRTTEHRIRINDDGTADHALRLIDIRSDATTDSGAGKDYRELVRSMKEELPKEFELKERRILDTKLYARGDTLIGEISYAVREISLIEGLRITKEALYVAVSPEREILRTNGKIVPGEKGASWIVWELDARRIFYVLREREWGTGRMLGPWHRGEKP
jgi:hypothetical protein